MLRSGNNQLVQFQITFSDDILFTKNIPTGVCEKIEKSIEHKRQLMD